MTTASTRTITLIPLPDLIDHPANPKTHDVEAITRSHTTLGTIDLITRDDRTGYTISGHGRTKALRHLHATGQPPPEGIQVAPDGTWLVPVVTGWSSKDDDHARAALVTLNTLTEAGGWDPEGLLATLEVLAQADADLLALTLRTESDIQVLARQVEALGVFSVGADHMLDEFRGITGTEDDPAEYNPGYVGKVTVYFRDEQAIETFRQTLAFREALSTNPTHHTGAWRLGQWKRYSRINDAETGR